MTRPFFLIVAALSWALAGSGVWADEAELAKLVERSDLIVQANVKVSAEERPDGIRWKLECTVYGTLKKEGAGAAPAIIALDHLQSVEDAVTRREPLPLPIDKDGSYILFLVRTEKDKRNGGPWQFADRWFGALPAAKGTAAKVVALAK